MLASSRWPCAALAAVALHCASTQRATAPAATGPAAPGEHAWREGDPIPSLKDAYQGQFLVGAAINPGMVVMGDSHVFLERQFNVVVAENEMKPLTLSKKEGQYDFAMSDALVDWAVKSGIKVRGHCLVWHQQAAPYMFSQDGKPASRELLVQRLRTYIHDVVGHFRGRVWAWDVVNEAFTVGEPNVDQENGWRRSEWYRIIGPDYVALAFQFAHEADPDALLFYNDYETQSPEKRRLILELVRSLQQKGIAIHGVGHQAHYNLGRPAATELEVTIQEVAKLGLRNHITEMDISMRDHWGAPMPVVTDAIEAEDARRYAEFFRMFRRNKDKIDAVLVWGVNDEASWLRAPDEPLLFREFQPKPQFWAVYDEASAPLQ